MIDWYMYEKCRNNKNYLFLDYNVHDCIIIIFARISIKKGWMWDW